MAAFNWFTSEKFTENVHLTRENSFCEDNRCNIWLIKGPAKDVVIDCGLGVCNLRQHFETIGLLEPAHNSDRPCEVIRTHVHFDHSGGAHHFENIFIHERDLEGLRVGRQTETLNYVMSGHFQENPYPGFTARRYRVPPTDAKPLRNGDRIDLGAGEDLEIIHVPGHTKGSIAIYYEKKKLLFSGDFVYNCSNGGNLIDWLPSSRVRDYVTSAEMMCDWLDDHDVTSICPGHFKTLSGQRTGELLREYVETKDSYFNRCTAGCLQSITTAYFAAGCFRNCPCECGP